MKRAVKKQKVSSSPYSSIISSSKFKTLSKPILFSLEVIMNLSLSSIFSVFLTKYNFENIDINKYVQDLFMFLEKNEFGTVILVNERVYHKKIKGTREIDIMTKNSIIEVKSGKVRHKTKQFLEQKDLANDHKKHHIVYAPDITDKKYLELKSKGINVVRTKDELLERNKK